jgi:hypothetical protein
LPPVPVHVSEYVALALRAPVDCEPLTARVPDQAPDAVQAVALLEDQAKVALPPLAMVLGLADKATVGASGVTDTVFDCVALPPAPVHVSEYAALAVSEPVDCEPLVALVPVHAPEAEHEVALLDDHVKVEAAPLEIVLGLALKLTVAVGVAVTVIMAD